MNLITTSNAVTMTSREIAELTEKRHDSVKRTIDTLADKGTVQLPQIVEVTNHLGQTVIEYRVGKRDTFVIVAQLSPEFTARLVDRWQELETRQQATRLVAPEVQMLDTQLALAQRFEVPLQLAQVEAVKAIKQALGTDLSPWLKLAPAQSNLKAEDVFLEPTDLGERLGFGKGQAAAIAMNKALKGAGLQTKTYNGWEPTAAAKGHAHTHQWAQGSKSGVNLKWRLSFVEDALGLSELA